MPEMSVAVRNSRALDRTGKPSETGPKREVANISTHAVIGGVHGPLARKRRATALVLPSPTCVCFIDSGSQFHSRDEPSPRGTSVTRGTRAHAVGERDRK